jgi:signal transduction histidine kinase
MLKFTDIDGSGKVYIKPNLRAILLKLRLKILVWDDRRQIQNLFQPRMTVSFKGTAGEKGAGLGLTLCKRFVDLNHGEISVTSQEGEGTTLKFITC